MITETVSNWFLTAVAFLAGGIPPLPQGVQDSMAGFHVGLADVMTYVGYFSPVVPFTDIGIAALLTAAFWALAVVLQVTRIAASFVTLGGGSV